MPKRRPGLGASLAIRESQEKVEREQVQIRQAAPAADNYFPPDSVLLQLLAECTDTPAALILGQSWQKVQAARKRLGIPTPWRDKPRVFQFACAKVIDRRWAMWQDALPPPLTAEQLEALITAETADTKLPTPGYSEELTTGRVLVAIRSFHQRHDCWPTRAEIAVAMDRAESDVDKKLTTLVKQTYVEKDGLTFFPTDAAPEGAKVTVTTWSREKIDAHLAGLAADKAPGDSPFAKIKKVPAATTPTVTTPQEVQHEMRGTPNPNRPKPLALMQAIEALVAQGLTVKEAIAVVASQISTPEHPVPANTVIGWYYKAINDHQANARAEQAPAAAPQASVPDDDPFGDELVNRIAKPPAVVAPAPEQALGGDGSTEQSDASAGLTAAQEGNLLAGGLTLEETATIVATLSTAAPTGEQLETLGPDFMPIDELPRLMTWWDQLAPEKQRDAHERLLIQSQKAHRLLTDRDIQIERFDAAVASRDFEIDGLELGNAKRDLEIERLQAEARELPILRGLIAAKHGRINALEAENTELQDGLKIALATIEQAAAAQPGSVTYILLETADRTTWLTDQGEALADGDEWPCTIIQGGRRRVEVWHCIERQTVPGGHIVCILRPGAAETAAQEAA